MAGFANIPAPIPEPLAILGALIINDVEQNIAYFAKYRTVKAAAEAGLGLPVMPLNVYAHKTYTEAILTFENRMLANADKDFLAKVEATNFPAPFNSNIVDTFAILIFRDGYFSWPRIIGMMLILSKLYKSMVFNTPVDGLRLGWFTNTFGRLYNNVFVRGFTMNTWVAGEGGWDRLVEIARINRVFPVNNYVPDPNAPIPVNFNPFGLTLNLDPVIPPPNAFLPPPAPPPPPRQVVIAPHALLGYEGRHTLAGNMTEPRLICTNCGAQQVFELVAPAYGLINGAFCNGCARHYCLYPGHCGANFNRQRGLSVHLTTQRHR